MWRMRLGFCFPCGLLLAIQPHFDRREDKGSLCARQPQQIGRQHVQLLQAEMRYRSLRVAVQNQFFASST